MTKLLNSSAVWEVLESAEWCTGPWIKLLVIPTLSNIWFIMTDSGPLYLDSGSYKQLTMYSCWKTAAAAFMYAPPFQIKDILLGEGGFCSCIVIHDGQQYKMARSSAMQCASDCTVEPQITIFVYMVMSWPYDHWLVGVKCSGMLNPLPVSLFSIFGTFGWCLCSKSVFSPILVVSWPWPLGFKYSQILNTLPISLFCWQNSYLVYLGGVIAALHYGHNVTLTFLPSDTKFSEIHVLNMLPTANKSS